MALQSPIVIVADRPSEELAATLKARCGCEIVETDWVRAANTVVKFLPSAVVIDEPATTAHKGFIAALDLALVTMRVPYVPVLARVGGNATRGIAGALPITEKSPPARVAARLSSALRIRTLHQTLARRGGEAALELSDADPLDDAVAIVTGRGRGYPELATAVGEQMRLIGALSVETAARHLNSRGLDGIFIGDGFGPPTVDAFLTALGEDGRFRDLPVALVSAVPVSADCTPLPNFERFEGSPADVVRWMLPLVRLHAYEGQLQRQLAAVETNGMLDPHTGLFKAEAFARDLDAAVKDALASKLAMSLARFSFSMSFDDRVARDTARQFARLVRSADFACQESADSILLALPNTSLRNAHVIARRIACDLKQAMLAASLGEADDDPTVTLAALKPTDTRASLLARVSEPSLVAAQ
jgi:GGDEF domain-containing protein